MRTSRRPNRRPDERPPRARARRAGRHRPRRDDRSGRERARAERAVHDRIDVAAHGGLAMSAFAAVLARKGSRWMADEVSLDECESIADIADVARDFAGDLRLVLIEQDDEYAAIVRLDDDDDDPRAFLSDGHAADGYPLAAVVADELVEIGEDELSEDEDAPPAHDSAPFGDAEIVDDLGTSPSDLLAMCAHEGTLPMDVLLAICEKAGCADVFDDLRA